MTQAHVPPTTAFTQNDLTAHHAQVIPSCIVALLARPIQGPNGPVLPGSLIAWTGKGFSERTRERLRWQIVRRLRARAAQMWSLTVNVRLVEGWERQLLAHERQRMQQLLLRHPATDFQSLTLKQVKTALGLPLTQALSILARIEALSGSISRSLQARSQAAVEAPVLAMVPVTPELRTQAEAALNLPWAQALSWDGVRFPYEGPGPLAQWIQAQLAGPHVPATLPKFLEQLLEADALTVRAVLDNRATNPASPRARGSRVRPPTAGSSHRKARRTAKPQDAPTTAPPGV